MIKQTWKMALDGVLANKMRTFLTMLGIIIGVSALIILVSIADGATNSVSDSISSIGTNYLTVNISDNKEKPLKINEMYELLDDKTIEDAAPISRTSVTAKNGYTNGTMNVYGTNGSYMNIMDLDLSMGRFLKNTDIDNNSYVIVISADTAIEFFGNINAEGETISLAGKSFKVVGVLSENESTTTQVVSSDSDDESTENVTLEGYIPYTTMSKIGNSSTEITQFYVSSTDEDTLDNTEKALEQIMLKRLNNDEDAFSIQSMSDVMEAMQEVNNTLSLMLGGIAAISLLVGGIGIMNIMLVSVTERTREIGIRKAIGATRGSIMGQFLMEAVIVSISGCIIGIGFSGLALKIISRIMNTGMTFQMNKTVVLVAVLFSAFIGIVFGIYPASKASAKKPIDALRYTG